MKSSWTCLDNSLLGQQLGQQNILCTYGQTLWQILSAADVQILNAADVQMLNAADVQILNAAEEREKQVVGLEEELARQRRDLEHEHSTRLAEAEATVRRLQVPFVTPTQTQRCFAT